MSSQIPLPVAPRVSEYGTPAFFGIYQIFATSTCSGMEFFPEYEWLVGPQTSIIVGATYLLTILLLTNMVKSGTIPTISKKDPTLKSFLWWYNIAQILVNTYMFCIFFAAYQNFGYVTSTTAFIEQTAVLFWVVKVVDFIDTYVIILKADWKRLSLLHVFHHATMPFHSGLCIACGHAKGFGLMSPHVNSFIHMVMYTHYLISSLGWRNPFKRYLTMLQLMQFTFLFSRSIFCMFFLKNMRDLILQEMVYQLYMLYLFSAFYDKAYKTKKQNKPRGALKTVEEAQAFVRRNLKAAKRA